MRRQGPSQITAAAKQTVSPDEPPCEEFAHTLTLT